MTTVNVGDVLAGKYRVEKILGIGGMGMVVAATHLELDQRVALKFMLPDAMRSDQAMDRFLREAKAAVKLRSEHVCRVLDVGRLETGAPYIVMEYMEGQDFADTIQRKGRLLPSDAVDYVMQALEGLAEAHVNNIVHRDLKPGNLFVTSDNEGLPLVKVLDFGISKSSVAGSATRTGEIMGSPSYMSPEQMTSSKNVDARADIWAMGVILYQALTAALPFDGDTLPALCMSVMTNQPPPINAHRPDVPPGLAAAIMRCMEKNPDARYRDVADLAAAIAPFGSPATAPASAMRIARVLRRSGTSPAVSNNGMPATIVATPAPSGRVTTLGGSAGVVEASATPTSPSATKLALFGLGAAAIAGVVVVMIFGGARGSSEHGAASVTPSSQPEVAAQPSAPAPAPTPPPPVAAPVPEAAPTPAPQPVVEAPVAETSAVTPVKTETTTKPAAHTTRTTTKTAVKSTAKVEATKPAAPVPPPTETKPAAPATTETQPAGSKWTRMQHDKSN